MIFTALINVLFFLLDVVISIISPLLPALPDGVINAVTSFTATISDVCGFILYFITFGGNTYCHNMLIFCIDIFILLTLYKPIIAVINKLLDLL